jgi:murein L,D-transpeptidase YcbB/YkuD
MALADQIAKRFQELEAQGAAVPVRQRSDGMEIVNSEAFQRWASSAMHLVSSVFGENSPHYRNLAKAYNEYRGYGSNLVSFRGVFLAAKSDYDGGHLYHLEATLSGEIFADFVVAAKRALSEGQKDVAAVLASAALEDALKRFSAMNGLAADGKVMQEVINALKSKGLVSGPQKSLLDSMPRVRDAAMHAEWTKLTAQDVGSMIGFVEQFLLTSFK